MDQLYNLDGVIGKDSKDIRKKFYVLKKNNSVYDTNIEIFVDQIDNACVYYMDLIVSRMFKGQKAYYDQLTEHYYVKLDKSKHYIHAGLGGESLLSKEQFKDFIENQISLSPAKVIINKFFFSFEVLYLASNVQNLCCQIFAAVCFFYDQFNKNNIFDGNETKEGLTTINSQDSRIINLTLESIIIKSASILDYLSKLAFEVENLPIEYANYPTRKSIDYKHGDSLINQRNPQKKLNWSELERKETIFEDNRIEVLKLKKLRNHIVHNGFLDIESNIYELKNNGVLKERFILMPDFNGTSMDKYKGRALFYSQDVKLNLILPDLLSSVMRLSFNTLEMLIKKELFGISAPDFNISIPDLRPIELKENPL